MVKGRGWQLVGPQKKIPNRRGERKGMVSISSDNMFPIPVKQKI